MFQKWFVVKTHSTLTIYNVMFVTKYASQHSPITSGSSLLEAKNNIEIEAKFLDKTCNHG